MSSATKVSSGPSLILIYDSDRCNGEDLSERAATATTDVLNVEFALDRVDQLNDAALSFEREQFPHQTQLSSKPIQYLQIGLEPTLEISIASIEFEKIKYTFEINSLTDYTPAQLGDLTLPNSETESRLDLVDQAGSSINGRCIQILPYPLLDGYVTNTDPFSDVNIAAYTGSDDEKKSWLESVITIPNAKVVDVNQVNLAFGLQTQREIKIMLKGNPDNNGDRLFFGDYAL